MKETAWCASDGLGDADSVVVVVVVTKLITSWWTASGLMPLLAMMVTV